MHMHKWIYTFRQGILLPRWWRWWKTNEHNWPIDQAQATKFGQLGWTLLSRLLNLWGRPLTRHYEAWFPPTASPTQIRTCIHACTRKHKRTNLNIQPNRLTKSKREGSFQPMRINKSPSKFVLLIAYLHTRRAAYCLTWVWGFRLWAFVLIRPIGHRRKHGARHLAIVETGLWSGR